MFSSSQSVQIKAQLSSNTLRMSISWNAEMDALA